MSPLAEPYRVPRREATIDLRLDGNEGPLPALDRWQSAVTDPEIWRRYPDPQRLQQRLADEFAVNLDQVLVTAGGDEALDRCCRALLAPQDRVLLPVPAFEMTERYLAAVGAEVVAVPWRGCFPLHAVLEAGVSSPPHMVVVTSPNNPTGAVATAADLAVLRKTFPEAILLVDLAYAEFADQDLTASALAMSRTVVVRTFSKAWSLAGARVGYALGDPALLRAMAATAGPYPVAGPSLAMALARLDGDRPLMESTVARVRQERQDLQQLAVSLGFAAEPSQANFVLVETERPRWLRDALAALGIAVRIFPGRVGLERAVRITCPGEAKAFARLRQALLTVRRPQALLLDLDGVLADVRASYRVAIRATGAHFGVPIDDHAIQAAKDAGQANDDWALTLRLLQQRGVDPGLEAVREVFERLYQGSPDSPGLRRRENLLLEADRLRAWADRMLLAVVTGRPLRDAQTFLDRFGIGDCFTTLVCREDAALKPDPAPVRLALERLGVNQAWMVGDTCDDLVAARGAEVLPIAVVAPGTKPQSAHSLQRAGAAAVLDSLDALDSLLP